ncbi:MAG TPA: hypothetical protein VE615_01205 [Gaiellaceae bacterium]|nr:hypothetical protein [Gaiellaceae bacterium]
MSDEPWPATDDFWLPLVDEPIGDIVAGIEADHPELGGVLDSPQKLLAFRTFAYIRVGLVLGRALMEREDGEGQGTETWVEALAREPGVRGELEREVLQVADEVAAEFEGDEPLGPDEDARSRFRAFAKRTLEDG